MLDLFCGLGGASFGYALAGFRVIGVDHVWQADYPFEFHQADAVEFGWDVAAGRREIPNLALVHASPPCQAGSAPVLGSNAGRGHAHPQLIPETREMLACIGAPTVMENLTSVAAGLRHDVVLCGLSFGLPVFRHRAFELGGWSAPEPDHVSHVGHRVSGWRHGVWYRGDVYAVYGKGGGKATTEECREALGIDWSWDRDQLVEAIPPAYTQWLGDRFLEHHHQWVD